MSATTPPPQGATDSATDEGSIPRRAVLVHDDGTTVEAGFFGDAGHTLFGVTTMPARPNGRGVVICSPILNDQLKNNRREVLLSRELARRGFAVQRFHYAGTGSSEGDLEEMTLDTMTVDAEAATAHLRASTGVDSLAFMGTRMSVIPAATLAARHGAPVALWEPTEGTAFFRDLFRGMMMIEMTSDGGGATIPELKARFEEQRTIDAAGFSVSWKFYENSDHRLADVLGDDGAPVFLAQFREKPELRREYVQLVEDLEARGHPVTTHHVLVDEAWMLFIYGFTAEEERSHSKALIDATANWFEVSA